MLVLILAFARSKQAELSHPGFHKLELHNSEALSVRISCPECVSVFIFDTDDYKKILLNDKINLTESHFIFNGTVLNITTKEEIEEPHVTVCVIPQGICNNQSSVFSFHSEAKLRVNFFENETSLCIFTHNDPTLFEFNQFFDNNPTNVVTNIYTNSSLINGIPEISGPIISNATMDEPFFISISGQATHGTILSLNVWMNSGNDEKKACSFTESPRFLGTIYNRSSTGRIEYIAACREIDDGQVWFLVKLSLCSLLLTVLAVSVIIHFVQKRRGNEELEKTLKTQDSLAEPLLPPRNSMTKSTSYTDENIVFFNRKQTQN